MPLTKARLTGWIQPINANTGMRDYNELSSDEYMAGIKKLQWGCEYISTGPCRFYLDWDKKEPIERCYVPETPQGEYFERDSKSLKEVIEDAVRNAPLLKNADYTVLSRKPRLVDDGKKVKFSYRIIYRDLITANHQKIKEYLVACGYKNNMPFDLSPYNKDQVINAAYCLKYKDENATPMKPYYGYENALSNMLITMYDDSIPFIKWDDIMPKPNPSEVVENKSPIDEEDNDDKDMKIQKTKALLGCIKAECEYQAWLEILMTIKSVIGDTDDAYDIADSWSAPAANYDARAFSRTWSSIKDQEKFTMGTLVYRAKNENPEKFKTVYQDVFKHSRGPTRSYNDTKAEFEKIVFKIVNPVCFYQFKSNGDYTITNSAKIKETYCDEYYTAKDKDGKYTREKFIKKWLDDPEKRRYEYVSFDPTMSTPTHVYNSFTGFKAATLPKNAVDVQIDIIIDHFKLLFKEHYEYVIKWCAQIVQHPNKKPNVCLILQSRKEGAGKTMFAEWFGSKILGDRYYRSVSDPASDLFSKHGNGINERLLICLEEAQGKSFVPYMDRFKELITGKMYRLEPKGVDAYEIPNYCSFIANTNNDNPIPISATDRRFCAFNCDNDKIGNVDYYTNLSAAMDDDNITAKFYEYLMNIKIDIINFQKERPETEYYQELKRTNIPSWAKWVSMRCDQLIRIGEDEEVRESKYTEPGSALYDAYTMFCNRCKYEPLKNTAFALNFKRIDGIEKRRVRAGMIYELDYVKIKKWLIKENLYDEDVL